jgi:hypothetical protein
MGGIYHLVKETGQTQFSTKFAAKLSFMPQKKTDCKKGNMKSPKKKCKIYITKNHDL